jgi:hypothetical protein
MHEIPMPTLHICIKLELFAIMLKGLGKNVMSGKAPRFALDLDDLRAKSRRHS